MSLEYWLHKLKPRTQLVARWGFEDFNRYLKASGGIFSGFGPDELVAWQRRNMGSYDLLDVVQDYLRQKQGTYEYKKRIYGSIRSFFLHNRCELPRDTFKVEGTRVAVVGRLGVDEFRRVLAACNVMYRAIFTCMLQGGMGVGELLEFDRNGYSSLITQLGGRVRPIRVDLPGRKKLKYVKPFYTFLGADAVATLEVWLKERPVEAGGHIFCTQFLQPLGYNAIQMYWLKKLKDLSLIKAKLNGDPSNRYGKNLHEIRDLFKTRWRISGVDIEIGDFLMGHDIDSMGYDKSPRDYPDWFEENYLKAEPWLNIISEDPERMSVAEHKARLREQRELDEAWKAEKDRELEILRRAVGINRLGVGEKV